MFKRFITSLFCLFLIFVSIPIFGFTDFFSVPVYAGTGPDNDGIPVGYSPAGLNDQVDAFRSYCKSRNLFIEGSALDTVSSVTSSIYQHLVADAGLDINQLQNEIYKRTQDNLGAQWFFTTTGIAAYNRLFAEFLQNNNLSVGDSVENNNLYSGSSYNGNAIYIFSYSANAAEFSYSISASNVTVGTLYPHNAQYYISDANSDKSITTREYTINLPDGPYTHTVYSTVNNNIVTAVRSYRISGMYRGFYYRSDYNYTALGDCIFYNQANKTFYWGTVGLRSNTYEFMGQHRISTESEDEIVPANIYYTTNNTTINNNNYEGDTYITNEGDIVNPPVDTTPGGKDPGWDVSGGQGSSGDTIINFPDFELPDLNIDWSIQGLGNKFPFSIPFDIVSLVTVLNAEPEAPRFQGTVNFGFTTWDYDINLQQFDTVAQVCRIAELLLLVFGLILITRSIIKG